MPDAPRIAAWQREIEREKDPQVKAFLQRCLRERLAEMRKQKKPGAKAIQAALEWQKP